MIYRVWCMCVVVVIQLSLTTRRQRGDRGGGVSPLFWKLPTQRRGDEKGEKNEETDK